MAAFRRRVIMHTPEPGAGAGQYVAELVRALAGNGVPVALMCPGNFAYREEVRAGGVEIISAPVRDVSRAGFVRRLARNLDFVACSLAKLCTSVHAGDIIHFQFALYFGLALLFFLTARLKGATVVLTAHDPLPHRWILPKFLRALELFVLRAGYAMCDLIVVHNEAGRRILLDKFGCDAARVAVIPHGPLHAAVGARPTRRGVTGPLRLLMFGSLRENKGLHLAVAALQEIEKRTPGAVTLTIAGCVPNSMEESYWNGCLQRIAKGPAGIAVIERAIGDHEIAGLFAAHHAVLLPYLNFYSDSGVAMLALSQRCPILATGAGGLGALLEAVDCGIAITGPTAAAVEGAIRAAAVLGPDALYEKGLRGCAYAHEIRSWDSIGRLTDARYRTLGPRVIVHTPEPMPSASLYVEELVSALASEEVPIALVCPANHQGLPALERNASVAIYACAARAIDLRAGVIGKIAANCHFLLSSCRTLFRSTRAGDVVHFQYILHLPFGLAFFLCAWLKRAKIVFTVHDPLPHQWLFPPVLRKLEMASLAWAYRWSDALIVHSQAGKNTLLTKFSLRAEKIHVIVHGPYELKTEPQKCGESDRLEVLLFGSFRENKGLHLAIEAFERLAREGTAARLTIAGQVVNRKEQAYWDACRQMINPEMDAVRLLERFVPDEELPALFSEHHCFLLPYTAFSSDSGVATIALSNGKPILATAAGGLGWLLEHSGGGLPIGEASPDGVAATVRRAVELGPAALERMGMAGKNWVLAECGWPAVARATRDLYAEFLLMPEAAAPAPSRNAA